MPATMTISFTPSIPTGQSAAVGAAVTFTQTSAEVVYQALRRDVVSEDKDATLTGRQVHILPFDASKPSPVQTDQLDGISISQVQEVHGDHLSDWAGEVISDQATHTVTIRRSNTLRPSPVLAAAVGDGQDSMTIKAATGNLTGRVVKGSIFTIAGISGSYSVTVDSPNIVSETGIAYYRCHMGINP